MKTKGKITINKNDIVGKHVGKLKVISYHDSFYEFTKGGARLRHNYLCECECGVVKPVRRGPLVSGIVNSCGCSRTRRK